MGNILTGRSNWRTITSSSAFVDALILIGSLDDRVAAAVFALRDRQVAVPDQGIGVRSRHGKGVGVDGQEQGGEEESLHVGQMFGRKQTSIIVENV